MRKPVKIIILFVLVMLFSSCKNTDNKDKLANEEQEKINIVQENENEKPRLKNPNTKYVGDYENDGLFSKISEIENCVNPDKLSEILSDIYGSKFTYEELEYNNSKDGLYFKESETQVLIGINGFYKIREDIMAKPKVYLFFQEFDDGEGPIISETPIFIMDNYGSYLVEEGECKYSTSELDEEEKFYMTAWSTLDLYMCERGYIDDDVNRGTYSSLVKGMNFFTEFEYLTTNYLQEIGVDVIDKIIGESPSSDQRSIGDNLYDENTNGETENTFGVKADNNFEEPGINELEMIKKVDGCTDPDEFCNILFEIYNCEFIYDVLSWDYNYNHLKSDNSGSYYNVTLFYSQRPKFAHGDMISDKAYLFYRAFYVEGETEPRFSKYPLFIMDNKGTYIIFDDTNASVIGWSPLELYAGYNGLFRDMYPQEIQMYKDLIKGFKNTVEVTEFFDKVRKHTETYD